MAKKKKQKIVREKTTHTETTAAATKQETVAASPDLFSKVIFFGLILIVIASVGIRFAEPVRDGDLWWQMVYGKYMVENTTPVVDHSIFTYTPTRNDEIYCAWLAEVVIYLIHNTFGLPFLFVFRYLCILTFVFLLYLHARRLKVEYHPLTWLVALIGILMSMTAAFIKPEIFSYVYISIAVFIWWRIKDGGEKAYLKCYLFPPLFLIWVNSHGAFIFGASFIAMLFFGELLNQLFKSERRLDPVTRKHFFICVFLSAAACFITPYTWKYIWMLVDTIVLPGLFHGKEGKDITAVLAYRSIFNKGLNMFHYSEFFYINIGIVVFLMAYRFNLKKFDWTLLTTNTLFAFLFCYFLRTTYFWAPVFSYSVIWMLSLKPAFLWPKKRSLKRVVEITLLVVVVFIAGRSMREAVCTPFDKRWFGFGIGYQNPVPETAFIKEHFLGMDIGNDYGIGGYLLWELWPESKIMIDPRQFPFLEWFRDYRNLARGKNAKEFLERFPSDVFIMRYRYPAAINYFIKSPEWRLAHYGPTCGVFVKTGSPADKILLKENVNVAASGLDEVRNINIFKLLYRFVMSINDMDNLKKIVYENEKYYHCSKMKNIIKSYQGFTEGVIAYRKKNYEKSIAYLRAAYLGGEIYNKNLLIKAYLNSSIEEFKKNGITPEVAKNVYDAVSIDPNNLTALFNGTVLSYHFEQKTKDVNTTKSSIIKNKLTNLPGGLSGSVAYGKRFLNQYNKLPADKRVKKYSDVITQIVNKQYKGDIFFITP